MALTHGDSCLPQIQKDCLSYKRVPQVLFCNQVVQRLLQICSKNWDGNLYRNDFFITKPSEPTKQSIILRLHISSAMSLPWVILKQIFQRFYLRTFVYNNSKVAARLKIWKYHAFSFFFFFFFFFRTRKEYLSVRLLNLVVSCNVSTGPWVFPLPNADGGACCLDIGFRPVSRLHALGWYCFLLQFIDMMYALTICASKVWYTSSYDDLKIAMFFYCHW